MLMYLLFCTLNYRFLMVFLHTLLNRLKEMKVLLDHKTLNLIYAFNLSWPAYVRILRLREGWGCPPMKISLCNHNYIQEVWGLQDPNWRRHVLWYYVLEVVQKDGPWQRKLKVLWNIWPLGIQWSNHLSLGLCGANGLRRRRKGYSDN